jgi:CheY-specific phosphatase CheX
MNLLPLSDDDLLVVLRDLWDATFAMPLEAYEMPEAADLRWAVVGIIGLDGPVADVVVQCSGDMARSIAARMLAAEELADDGSAPLVDDLVGEAANIIAGNVKGILELDTTPVVARDDLGRWASAQVIDRSAASC